MSCEATTTGRIATVPTTQASAAKTDSPAQQAAASRRAVRMTRRRRRPPRARPEPRAPGFAPNKESVIMPA